MNERSIKMAEKRQDFLFQLMLAGVVVCAIGSLALWGLHSYGWWYYYTEKPRPLAVNQE